MLCDTVIGLLGHINGVLHNTSIAQGVGIDYDAELIKSAGIKSSTGGADAKWLVYDFNLDVDDLASTLIDVHHVTHVFIYLVPKQLALPTVRLVCLLTNFPHQVGESLLILK